MIGVCVTPGYNNINVGVEVKVCGVIVGRWVEVYVGVIVGVGK
jgi:hypothetical protein